MPRSAIGQKPRWLFVEHLSHDLHTARKKPTLQKAGHLPLAHTGALSVARFALFVFTFNDYRSVCAGCSTSQCTAAFGCADCKPHKLTMRTCLRVDKPQPLFTPACAHAATSRKHCAQSAAIHIYKQADVHHMLSKLYCCDRVLRGCGTTSAEVFSNTLHDGLHVVGDHPYDA